MNTRDIEAFIAVVDTGSIVGAALRLHLTQPAISRRIQSLEASLGATVLDRQSKPLKPSAAGREVYVLGQRVLSSVADLVANVDTTTAFSGEFRLGVPGFLAELILAQPVDRLLDSFPRLSLRVSSGWSPKLRADVQNNVLDVAVILAPNGSAPADRLVLHKLADQTTLIVAANTLPLPDRELSLAELAPHRWILSKDGCGFRGALSRAFQAAGLPFEVSVEAYGAELQLSLVARGLGLGLVTQGAYARSAFRDRLSVVAVPEVETGAALWLVHASHPGRLSGPIDNLLASLGLIDNF